MMTNTAMNNDQDRNDKDKEVNNNHKIKKELTNETKMTMAYNNNKPINKPTTRATKNKQTTTTTKTDHYKGRQEQEIMTINHQDVVQSSSTHWFLVETVPDWHWRDIY